MTKHVFQNNDQVAHAWAHQTTTHGRNSNNSFSFEGPTIFSYRTVIGIILGETHVAVSARRFSNTTNGKHLPAVRSAVSHKSVLRVQTIPSLGDWQDKERFERWATAEIEHFEYEVKEKRALISKQNKNLVYALQKFVIQNPESIKSIMRRAGMLNAHSTYYAAQSALELNIVTEEERQGWRAKYDKYLKNQNDPQRLERLQKQQILKNAEKIQKWRNGELAASLYGLDQTLLRYDSHNEMVVTSKSVRITKLDALKALAAFSAGKLVGEKLNGYTITQVSYENRVVIAGCHTVPFDELEHVYTAITGKTGLIPQPNRQTVDTSARTK